MAAGFIIDASEAEILMRDLADKRARIVTTIHRVTLQHARLMKAAARAGAPKGPHTKGFANSIDTRTKQFAGGTECTIESKHPLGAILEYGGAYSRPWNMFGAAADTGIPAWENALGDAVADLL
jgi:hypothetical protein